MILASDVQQLFERLYGAHRNVAFAEDRLARAKSELEQSERELDDSQRVLRDLNGKLNDMAKRAAGTARIEEQEPAPRSEFVPVRVR